MVRGSFHLVYSHMSAHERVEVKPHGRTAAHSCSRFLYVSRRVPLLQVDTEAFVPASARNLARLPSVGDSSVHRATPDQPTCELPLLMPHGCTWSSQRIRRLRHLLSLGAQVTTELAKLVKRNDINMPSKWASNNHIDDRSLSPYAFWNSVALTLRFCSMARHGRCW